MTSALLALCLTTGCLQSQQVIIRRQAISPQIMYFVGAPYRMESMLQLQQQQDPDWAEFQQFKAWKAQQPHGSGQTYSQPQQQNSVQLHCAKCHAKDEPEGGFYLSGEPGIEAATITRAIRLIADNKMPKDRIHKPLTREEKNALLGDLLALEQTADTAAEDIPATAESETSDSPPLPLSPPEPEEQQ